MIGMSIEIAGTYPCSKCGAPLIGWQSKDLRDNGDDIEPLLQSVKLNSKISGEIHTHHAVCGHFTDMPLSAARSSDSGRGTRRRHRARMGPTDPIIGSARGIGPADPR